MKLLLTVLVILYIPTTCFGSLNDIEVSLNEEIMIYSKKYEESILISEKIDCAIKEIFSLALVKSSCSDSIYILDKMYRKFRGHVKYHPSIKALAKRHARLKLMLSEIESYLMIQKNAIESDNKLYKRQSVGI